MGSRAIVSGIAALTLGAAMLPASGFARGGSDDHAGFFAGARAPHVRPLFAGMPRPAGVAVLRVRPVAHRPRLGVACFGGSAIPPVMIRVPSAGAMAGLVPPFSVPLVAPVGWPVVVMPDCATRVFTGVPVYWPEAAGTEWGPGGDEMAGPALPPVAPAPYRDPTPITPDSPVTACRPVPFGYHCDWPSQ